MPVASRLTSVRCLASAQGRDLDLLPGAFTGAPAGSGAVDVINEGLHVLHPLAAHLDRVVVVTVVDRRVLQHDGADKVRSRCRHGHRSSTTH